MAESALRVKKVGVFFAAAEESLEDEIGSELVGVFPDTAMDHASIGASIGVTIRTATFGSQPFSTSLKTS